VIFDNIRHTIKVVACAYTEDADTPEDAYGDACARIDEMIALLAEPARFSAATPQNGGAAFESNMTPERYRAMVEKARDYIAAGDVIQVVLSQRFSAPCNADPVDLYRALRYVNPSPYLFFLKLDDLTLIGSSPEVMVRLEQQEDRMLSDELLSDEKERAEHVMLVDLGRNDLGRIAAAGTVQVNQYMVVEKYSHVMHLVSNVRAQLAKGKDAFDVLAATFPAGTLSGAPKVRAMQIIDELEPVRRGAYGGAVGYVSFTGNMDLCITIRTMVIRGGRIFVQAGAGIVYDSRPDAEHRETLSKARAIEQAVALAAGGFVLENGK
jgi:anthranilate synthase component 1